MTAVTPLATALPDTDDAAAAGAAVLRQEAAALEALADGLDGAFTRAVDLLEKTTGRVIVTGMGKSGHIGAKIAATLASTGTPAFFVHPGEASHGDLGMIAPDDAVIAISHSGETRELGDIVAYCARFRVPLVALTGRADGTLAKAADVPLLNGVTTEACPLNLAPTTSTTATLALGDALAVALMQRRGFKHEDFARYHPGGKLGSRLSLVAELMAKESALPLLPATVTMDKVVLEIAAKRLGLVALTNSDGTLAGVITDGDLKRHLSPDLLEKPATDIMTATPQCIAPDKLATAAVALMQEKQITALVVLDDQQQPVGVLHIHHCLQAGVI